MKTEEKIQTNYKGWTSVYVKLYFIESFEKSESMFYNTGVKRAIVFYDK